MCTICTVELQTIVKEGTGWVWEEFISVMLSILGLASYLDNVFCSSMSITSGI